MLVHPNFPQHRREDPMRRAEARVYDQLANNDRPGLALYELELGHPVPELDFALWLEGVGHYGLQVKGGHHSYTEGQWFLRVDGAPQAKPDPAQSAWDAAMGVRDVIARRLGRRIYIVPALVFPDMDPDEHIDTRMSTRKVSVLWGSHDLIDRLIALPANRKIFHPPTASEVREEVDLVTGGLLLPAPAGPAAAGAPPPVELAARRVIVQHGESAVPAGSRPEIPAGGITIHHVDTLIVHTTPGLTPDAGEDEAVRE